MKNDDKKLKFITFLLSIINIICAIMHIVFECPLMNNESIYREFLLIENILMAVVFIYLWLSIFYSDRQRKLYGFKINIVFWIIFIIIVIIFKPKVTTLNMVRDLLIISQGSLLLITAIISLVLSLLGFILLKKDI